MENNRESSSEMGLEFNSSSDYSLGVEIEFQTLDKATWDLAPLAPVLLENAPELLRPRLSPEFIQSILEIQTGVCSSVADVENDLMQTISMAEELAEDNNCMLFAASLHPFASHRDQLLTTNERYERLIQELQLVGRRFISQGLHVHIGMPDGDTAIRVCNGVQAYLPLLLSLSTSSPFSQGEDTGFMSYRTKLFEALPLAGNYAHIPNWHGFTENIRHLQEIKVIESISDLWWDARPNPQFGTLEIRICDLPLRFFDLLGITSIIQALAATLAEEKQDYPALNPYVVQANKWQAARHGLNGKFVDPLNKLVQQRSSIAEAVIKLMEYIEPMTVYLGSTKYTRLVKRIQSDGTGADFLRQRYKEYGNLKEVIQSLRGEFWL